jgi:hypothetical protein
VAKTPKGVVQPPVRAEEQEEMTVIVLRIKGGGDTLQKGFDALSTAFAALGTPQTAPSGNTRKLAGNASARQLAAPTPADDSYSDDEDEDEDYEDESSSIETPHQAEAVAGAKWKPRKYKFMDDLDLSQGDKPWKEFASERGGKNDNDHYLLASLWLTECANLPEFGVAHVFTLFRAMQWSEQSDFSQPMRLMKSKKSYFSHPSKKTWKLTGPGLDAARAIHPADPK